MSLLHLVRRSAFETQDFEQCINQLTSKDSLVLLDDGCYNLGHPLINQVTVPIKVLQDHAQARAITLLDDSQQITMTELVQMTFRHQSIVTWQ